MTSPTPPIRKTSAASGSDIRCDVAVIGAGPSGSLVAATLARRGAAVALIDPSHPREKPCGGGLTGRALSLIDNLLDVSMLPRVRIQSARFLDTLRQQSASVELGDAGQTLVVASRAAVDSALFAVAARAGATIVREQVTQIEVGRPHVISTRGGRRIEAACIVGADGANSFVRRRFSTPFRRDQLSIATGYYAHGITSDEIVLEMTDGPPGYIWSFPRPDHLAIGICAQATDTTVGTLRHTLDRWMQATGIARGARLEPYSWPIPSLRPADFGRTTLGGEGWLTVGDAAGLVDPITREGIFFALQSGLFAADSLASGRAAAHRHYRDRVRDEITSELSAAAALKSGFFRPRFTRLLNDALGSSPQVRAVMADLIVGAQPYRTLRRRLLWTLEVGLAWRLLRNSQRAP